MHERWNSISTLIRMVNGPGFREKIKNQPLQGRKEIEIISMINALGLKL